ncbi:hypothetical protein PVL29_012238 [Vitis rotundifolia]|uniref:Disease resistance R13L4/SHOC-2-like LRR domain-containing protein n=1 Tax=Vitis rotundifolia TaxID=103349 RepID=A0AA39DRV3_VITRO|nr:hypothetical protein PVL29_012238 [Vitis rotundifolia]
MNLSGEIRSSLIKLKSLKYLDLSFNSYNAIPIPQFFGSLKNLLYLNLSNVGFSGVIPSNLGNLSSLQHLDLSSRHSNDLYVDNIEWTASLVSLKYLDMDFVDLALVESQWVEVLNKLPALTELHLDRCNLIGSIPSPSFVNFTSLLVITISSNQFNFVSPEWLLNISNLESIDISYNQLHGRILLGLGELPKLQYLDLSMNRNLRGSISQLLRKSWKKIEVLNLGYNELHDKLLVSIGNFCNLKYLDLSLNNLDGSVPEIIKGIGTCNSKSPLPNLRELYLDESQLMGKLPKWLGELQELRELHLSDNKFEGSIPTSLGTLQQLEYMNLEGNELNGSLPNSIGQLSQLHFLDLSKLEELDLNFNTFSLNVRSNWVPPFQVRALSMGSCHLGPSFPAWLRSQKNLQYLRFSNANISSSIPNWFWNMSFKSVVRYRGESMLNLHFLFLSENQIIGVIPSNIGESLPKLFFLSLSSNQITGTIPDSIGHITSLQVIDLSRNNLFGSIPSTINYSSRLVVIDVGKNNLSRMIPKSLGQLQLLQSLHLKHNKLSGKLPSYFQNLTIPAWIGVAFENLVILSLRSNVFSGRLPSQLSNLSSLHVLDIAQNNLIGEIPITLVELKAMTQEYNMNIYPLYVDGTSSLHEERLVVIAKGQSLEYTKTLSLVVGIDLSENNLSEEFPQGITKLNHITGQIPENISMLHQLSSLDLSSNKLFGIIPSSMSLLSFLSYLNLSNNNFFGKIPFIGHMTTFTELTFVGNPDLCGAPLVRKCQDKKQSVVEDKNDGGYIDQWFYLSVGLGFAVGILVPFFVLAIRKSWCDAYFDFVKNIVKWLLRGRATYARNHPQR